MHALVLINSLTDLSLIVNRKMKYRIVMSTIIIFTISIQDISNWAIMVGKVRLNFGWFGFKVRLVLFSENFIYLKNVIWICSGTPTTRTLTTYDVATGLGQRKQNLAEGGPLATVAWTLANTQEKS